MLWKQQTKSITLLFHCSVGPWGTVPEQRSSGVLQQQGVSGTLWSSECCSRQPRAPAPTPTQPWQIWLCPKWAALIHSKLNCSLHAFSAPLPVIPTLWRIHHEKLTSFPGLLFSCWFLILLSKGFWSDKNFLCTESARGSPIAPVGSLGRGVHGAVPHGWAGKGFISGSLAHRPPMGIALAFVFFTEIYSCSSSHELFYM